MKPLEIQLPTCPDCGKVSAIDSHFYSGKVYCQGSQDNKHSKTQMTPRLFREVSND